MQIEKEVGFLKSKCTSKNTEKCQYFFIVTFEVLKKKCFMCSIGNFKPLFEIVPIVSLTIPNGWIFSPFFTISLRMTCFFHYFLTWPLRLFPPESALKYDNEKTICMSNLMHKSFFIAKEICKCLQK